MELQKLREQIKIDCLKMNINLVSIERTDIVIEKQFQALADKNESLQLQLIEQINDLNLKIQDSDVAMEDAQAEIAECQKQLVTAINERDTLVREIQRIHTTLNPEQSD